ncbi:AAA family ATPase [Hoyosella subflava]|uniref:Putative serine/threonine protein kinase n=1 Tax=Hoyosella subflava (strain DSM 45089 / JCM 17490 / NBRC 109087 / DQS3-9A1) TaxID=443218 RepID=F6ENP9_HOYSD|nr:putative serine/threonine protein kinase [Hoyosella subflava]AEF42906.1 Putative serine/threonine protein kinase [Hoyosella subflava DQS3-9A1]
MAIEPEQRPQSAAQFGELLRAVQKSHRLGTDEMAILGQSSARSGELDEPPKQKTPAVGVSRPGATQLAPPTAPTKFRPPTTPRTLVQRDRLLRSIDGERHRLILIHAPAGFGKTTLASQLCYMLREQGAQWTWLSIDPDDNNTVWFLAHLIEAVRKAEPIVAAGLEQTLEEHGSEAQRYVLTALINEIHESGKHITVVLDDWHRVTSKATIGAVEYLLDNGCDHLTLIVTSRSRSGLPLGRMRVRGELIEVDARDLRFDVHEAEQFLAESGDASLTPADAAALCATTDGWVAALQLASLSLRGKDNPADLISHLSGRHRAIAEYLAENVLNTLDPPTLDFMLSISVTERVCGSLAESLSGTLHGQARLEEIEDNDLFLYALDEERQWFRYHHLFAEFLQRRLERDRPGRATELHRAASDWFASRSMLREAVDHAVAAGAADLAADLVESSGLDLLELSHLSTIVGLTSKLSPHLVATRPRLLLNLAWAQVLLRRPDQQVKDTFSAIASGLEAASLSDSERDSLSRETTLLQGIQELFKDRTDGIRDSVKDCLMRPQSMRPFVAAAAANVASVAAYYDFDFDSARKWHERARRYFDHTEGPFTVVYGNCIAGLAAHEQLDIAAAELHFRTALNTAHTSTGGANSHAARLASAVLGDLLYEQGAIDEAERLLDDSYALGPEGGTVDFMLASYGTGSRVKALRENHEAASARLQDGARIAQTLSLPRLAARIENERVRAGLHQGYLDVPAYPDSDAENYAIALRTAELGVNSALRANIRCSSPAEIEDACRHAKNLVTRLADARRPRALLQAQLLHAMCLHAAGHFEESAAVLAPAARLCAKLGLTQLLRDDGPPDSATSA